MTQARHEVRLMASALLVLALAGGGGCTRESAAPGEFAGSVLVDDIRLSVPQLALPEPDLEVGFPPAADAESAPPSRHDARSSIVKFSTSLGQRALVASVPVTAGQSVSSGDVIAVLDDRLLALDVEQARLAARTARASVKMIDSRLGEVSDSRTEVAEARATLEQSLADARRARAELVSKLDDARAALKQVEAALSALPPGVPAPPGLPDPNELRAGIGQLENAIARIDSGIAKAKAGRAELTSASGRLGDAERALRNARELAVIGVQAADVNLKIAKQRLADSTIRSPADATIVQVARVGDVLAPGAPLATLRPRLPSRVRVWVQPEQLAELGVGTRADVLVDSAPGQRFVARVSATGAKASFPPTTLSTRIIHLTRAVPVELTLDGNATLAPGTPADVIVKDR